MKKKLEKKKLEKKNSTRKFTREKKLKLRSLLEVGGKVIVLASRLKKKDSLGKFNKSSVDNKSYFQKSDIF